VDCSGCVKETGVAVATSGDCSMVSLALGGLAAGWFVGLVGSQRAQISVGGWESAGVSGGGADAARGWIRRADAGRAGMWGCGEVATGWIDLGCGTAGERVLEGYDGDCGDDNEGRAGHQQASGGREGGKPTARPRMRQGCRLLP
jgi:hypothetical protein